MRIFEAKEMLSIGESLSAEIMRNPDELSEWIIWIRDSTGKSYILFTDDAMLIKSIDANSYFQLLKSIGFKQATIIF